MGKIPKNVFKWLFLCFIIDNVENKCIAIHKLAKNNNNNNKNLN